MNILNNNLHIDNQANADINCEDLIQMMNLVINQENLSKDSFVNLRLSCDGEIRKLNAVYLGRDSLTDVISFQANMPGFPGLGDIIIDTNVASAQKGERSLSEEILILFLHGLLHLLGYDHLNSRQAKIMQKKEHEFLKLFKETNK